MQRSLDVLHRTAAQGRSKPFRNLITDRDGTTNNYCDRYASSVQPLGRMGLSKGPVRSAYNAAWLSNFSRHCVDNAAAWPMVRKRHGGRSLSRRRPWGVGRVRKVSWSCAGGSEEASLPSCANVIGANWGQSITKLLAPYALKG